MSSTLAIPAPTVSLVIIDTDSYVLGLRAVQQSLQKHHFDQVLIFSDDETQWPGFSVVKIKKMEVMHDYNFFVIKELAQYIQTDFFLLTQYDGFIVNESCFSSEYYQCDYIGAPWAFFEERRVGNGGFSWRSKKLAQAIAGLDYSWGSKWPEDIFICRNSRTLLELDYGCRFADVALAKTFSTEGHLQEHPSFGFHGLSLLPYVYREEIDFLICNLAPRVFRKPKQWKMLSDGMAKHAPHGMEKLLQRKLFHDPN